MSIFFQSVFTEEPNDNVPKVAMQNVEVQMPNLIISKESVYRQLNSIDISKSPGPDNIHPRILKELALELSKPLTIIFNNVINTSNLPKEWKKGNITAIFKKGQRNLASNYRPISLTCLAAKIMEKIIRDHIIAHMKANKLFSNKQYGFISGRSTTLQLLYLINGQKP